MPNVEPSNKPNLRNTRIFREELLGALGVTDDLDVENEQNFKSALLTALNVEHGYQDIANFEAWREKLIDAALNISEGGGGGGGGSDYEILEFVYNPSSQTYVSAMTAGELYNSSKTNYAIVLTDNDAFGGYYSLGKPYVMVYKGYEDGTYFFLFNLVEYDATSGGNPDFHFSISITVFNSDYPLINQDPGGK